MIARLSTVMLTLSALLGALIAPPGARAENIMRGGQPAELTVAAAGAHGVRVTLKPVGMALPPSPSLHTLEIKNPAIRLRTIEKLVQARIGALDVEITPSPLTILVKGATGREVQKLVFDEKTGHVSFNVGDAPVLGLGEGGQQPEKGSGPLGVQFDRRGKLDMMRGGWFQTEVLTYYREFAGEKADDEQGRARTAQAASRVGWIEFRLGRKEQSRAAFQMAHDSYRALAADFPAAPAYRQKLAQSHHNLGSLLDALGKRAEAQEQYRQALAILQMLADDFPAVPDHRRSLALSQNNLGIMLDELGQRAEAQARYRQALALQEKLAADFPAEPDYRMHLAGSHNNLAASLGDQRKPADAEKHYRQALAIRTKLAADFPAVPDYSRWLANSRNALGGLLRNSGRRADAQEQYRQALSIQEKLAAEFPAVPAHQISLGGSYCN